MLPERGIFIKIKRAKSTVVGLKNSHQSAGEKVMSKEKKSNKEEKKKPAMTTKEKRAAKKSKKDSKAFLANDKNR
jgi:hypothetical protein